MTQNKRFHDLEFDLVDDQNRPFNVQFLSESPTKNTLMAINYLDLPIDTVSLPQTDKELYDNICQLMETTAINYWIDISKEEPANTTAMLNEQFSQICKALQLC